MTDSPSPPPRPRRSVAWLVLGGVLGAGSLGMLFFSRGGAPAPASIAAEAARARQEAEETQAKIGELQRQLAAVSDEGERIRLEEKLKEKTVAGVKGGSGGRARRPSLPGDPLAGFDGDETTAPAAPAASVRLPTPVSGTQAEAALDPNGRFATTYRPGGGHLSAFESAVSRGILPASERELVADVGARYSAAIDAPKGKALAIKADWERPKLQPGGGPVHLRLALRSSAEAAQRPHLSVHLVLDVSGSMAGESIDNARKAAQTLVDKLAPGDDFSLVTFSSDAQVLITDGPVGARREQIKTTIAGIKEGGGTNISAGLGLGYKQAQSKGIPEDAMRVVLLLSDGKANSGMLHGEQLARMALDAFQEGVQTSTFGLGTDYDGPLMSAIASEGAGGYYYLRDAQQIAPALTTEIDKRLDPVASAVEVRVRLKPGIELLNVYGSRRLNEAETARVRAQEVAADQQAKKRDGIKQDRQDDQEGGMRFFMPAFARDDNHTLLLKLRAPAAVGSKPVALIELKYKDRLAKKNASDEFPISIQYASSDAESGASIDPSVSRTVQGFLAGESLAQAAAFIAQNHREQAAALLREREGILRQAASQLGEPLLARDADRLARLLSHVAGPPQPGSGASDPLVLAMLLETAGRVHMH